jgi:hypothetical protein
MEALKILEKPSEITWDYDEEADVLYSILKFLMLDRWREAG